MTDRTDHVLDAIDGALDDWATSPDAMRWSPDGPDDPGHPAGDDTGDDLDATRALVVDVDGRTLGVLEAREITTDDLRDADPWEEYYHLMTGVRPLPRTRHWLTVRTADDLLMRIEVRPPYEMHLGPPPHIALINGWITAEGVSTGRSRSTRGFNGPHLYFETLRDASAGPAESLSDPRQRALDHIRNRNTGPPRDQFPRRGRHR